MTNVLEPLIKKFMPFAQKRMGFNEPPKLFLKGDKKNADNPLGKTAYYDPSEKAVTLYVTGRHPKDVMRSLSHELVHHTQNCRGDFDNAPEMEEGYAQNDEHLREMEREAYEVGNMCFRDWEDSIKQTIYFEHLQKGEKKMSTKDWKNKEISTLLSEAWGFKFNSLQEFDDFSEGADKNTGMSGVDGDDKDDTYMGHVKEDAAEEAVTEAEEETVTEEEEPVNEEEIQETGAKDTGASKGDESKTHKGEKDYTTKKDDDLKDTEDDGARGEKKGDKAYVNEEADADATVDEIVTEDSGEEEGHHYDDNRMSDDEHIKAIEHHLDALRRDRDYDDDHIDENVEAVAEEAPSETDALREAIKAVLTKHLKG